MSEQKYQFRVTTRSTSGKEGVVRVSATDAASAMKIAEHITLCKAISATLRGGDIGKILICGTPEEKPYQYVPSKYVSMIGE